MLGFDQSKPFDFPEVTVAPNECCVSDDGGCGDPEVVLIQRKATALLRNLDIRVLLGSGGGDRFTRQYGEQFAGFPFEFSTAPPRRQPLQAEEDLAADDGTDDHTIIESKR